MVQRLQGPGFIDQQGDVDVIVHHSATDATGFKSLKESDRVAFVVQQRPRGFSAKNVTKTYYLFGIQAGIFLVSGGMP